MELKTVKYNYCNLVSNKQDIQKFKEGSCKIKCRNI